MPRNSLLQVIRGVKANIPSLFVGEQYFATDMREMYVGSSIGNIPVGILVYSAAGVLQDTKPPHIVADTVTLTGGTVTVTLTGGAAFTSATSYVCVASDITAKNRSPMITQNSGTSITFSGNAGDVVHFICVGY